MVASFNFQKGTIISGNEPNQISCITERKISLKISEETYNNLAKIAEKSGANISDIAEQLICERIKEKMK